jgi:hypothetical protein
MNDELRNNIIVALFVLVVGIYLLRQFITWPGRKK